jgi:hypothetical protein
MASRFSADTGFSAPQELTEGSAGAAPAYAQSIAADSRNGPRIAVDRWGRALAVWVSDTGGIWYSSYE